MRYQGKMTFTDFPKLENLKCHKKRQMFALNKEDQERLILYKYIRNHAIKNVHYRASKSF